jgi:hypothetical protein
VKSLVRWFSSLRSCSATMSISAGRQLSAGHLLPRTRHRAARDQSKGGRCIAHLDDLDLRFPDENESFDQSYDRPTALPWEEWIALDFGSTSSPSYKASASPPSNIQSSHSRKQGIHYPMLKHTDMSFTAPSPSGDSGTNK